VLPGDEELASLLEESAEDVYEHAPVGYMSTLVDGTFVKVNETLLAWTKHTRADVLNRMRLHDLLAPGARIYYETHYAPLLQMQGEIREIAVELVRSDGTRLPVLMSSSLVRDDEGRPRIIRTTVFDASDRRRYERELLRARVDAETRARSAHALVHVAEGVMLVGETGMVELLNPAAERILGVVAADAVGRPAADAVEGWADIAEARDRRVVPRARGGGEQWLEVSAADAGSSIVYTLRDVSGEHALDRMRNELVAIVSHELRTPLTGAYGAAQTLHSRGDQLDPATRAALLEMVVEQTRRLSTIVEQILLTSRLDTGNVLTEIDSFDASAALDGIVQAVADDHRQRLLVDTRDGLRVQGDLDRLRQVLANLVDNALKYSNGPVRVGVEPRDLSVRFVVGDEGAGIPAEEQTRIFEKFYRLDPDLRGGVGGTGLGLYIARELVTRMGGRIGLVPRERGTTFYVDLPAA
jgi:PAS domain S-box-containing protein